MWALKECLSFDVYNDIPAVSEHEWVNMNMNAMFLLLEFCTQAETVILFQYKERVWNSYVQGT